MTEIQWKYVEEFPQYVVNDRGDVKHFLYNRPIRSRVQSKGHSVVVLTDVDGKHYTRTVGSLVARAFMGEPEGKAVVHINGDLEDNNVENLRYASRSEIQTMNHKAGTKQTRRVRNKDTGEIYFSIAEAARQLGVRSATVSWVLRGKTGNLRSGVQLEYYIE